MQQLNMTQSTVYKATNKTYEVYAAGIRYYVGNSRPAANAKFSQYVSKSKSGRGHAANSVVELLKLGQVVMAYTPENIADLRDSDPAPGY